MSDDPSRVGTDSNSLHKPATWKSTVAAPIRDDAPPFKSPVVLRPTLMTPFDERPLPPPWPGGKPRFPIDAAFYVAALRAELAWMIHAATRFRTLLDEAEPVDSYAANMLGHAVWGRARGFFHYTEGLLRLMGCGLRQVDSMLRVVGMPEGRFALSAMYDMADEMRFKHSSTQDYARFISDPSRLAGLKALYDSLCPFELDFTKPLEPLDATETSESTSTRQLDSPHPIPSPAASVGQPEAKSQAGDLTPGGRAIAAAYELQREGKPVSLRAACKRAKVDRHNLRCRFPEAVATIEALSRPAIAPRRGGRDRRTGDVDGWDSGDD